ncbi:hypothetical protein GGX14DRAFT_406591 [Mycena pura]|uniref:Uncharacterized protein n=1 Tax=Mycena pura TaxID=153505 RepID=A0AAD6XY38_9AGAR|nr:hypothetical protein GGX14DRAFT_406591 [Mycena pura]
MTNFSEDAFIKRMKTSTVQRDSYTSNASTHGSETNPLAAPAFSVSPELKYRGDLRVQHVMLFASVRVIRVNESGVKAPFDLEPRDAMFKELILADKALHGAVHITIQVTNDVQQEVADLIDPASADAASTPTSDDAPGLSLVVNGSGDLSERDNGDTDDCQWLSNWLRNCHPCSLTTVGLLDNLKAAGYDETTRRDIKPLVQNIHRLELEAAIWVSSLDKNKLNFNPPYGCPPGSSGAKRWNYRGFPSHPNASRGLQGLDVLNAVDEPEPAGITTSVASSDLDLRRDGIGITLPFFRDLLADRPVGGASWSLSEGVDRGVQNSHKAAGKMVWDMAAEKWKF